MFAQNCDSSRCGGFLDLQGRDVTLPRCACRRRPQKGDSQHGVVFDHSNCEVVVFSFSVILQALAFAMIISVAIRMLFAIANGFRFVSCQLSELLAPFSTTNYPPAHSIDTLPNILRRRGCRALQRLPEDNFKRQLCV